MYLSSNIKPFFAEALKLVLVSMGSGGNMETNANFKSDRKPAGMLPLTDLKALASNPESLVSRKVSTVRMCLMPGVLNKIKEGLEAQLMPHLNRYYPAVGAILLGWEGLRCCQPTGRLVSDSPAIHVEVTGSFYIFSPQIGSVLPARVNKMSEKHIGCLIHETFNISLMGDRMDSSVTTGEVISIEVTKLFWGYRGVPVVQGRLLGERGQEPEYDSGIDSSVTVVTPDPEAEEVSVNPAEEKTSRKSKKRKREEEIGDIAEAADAVGDESLNCSSKSKKKKKKDDSSTVETQDTTLSAGDESIDGPPKKKKKKKKDTSD